MLTTNNLITKPIDKIINLCKNNTNLKILAHHFLGNGTWLICANINYDDMSYLLFPLSTETSTRDIQFYNEMINIDGIDDGISEHYYKSKHDYW